MKTTFNARTGEAVLIAETDADKALLDAVDLHRAMLVNCIDQVQAPGGVRNVAIRLTIDSNDPRVLRAEAGAEALDALGTLLRVARSDAASRDADPAAVGRDAPPLQMTSIARLHEAFVGLDNQINGGERAEGAAA